MAGNENTKRLDPFDMDTQQNAYNVEKSSASAASSGSKIIYDGAGDVIPLYEGKEFLLYFDFLFRFWIYFDTVPHGVAYLSAFGFFLGGILFMIGTFSVLSPSVLATFNPLSCGTDAYSWWTLFTYLLGDVVWQIACTLQIIESLNRDYESKIEAWEANRMEGPKPKYRWFGIRILCCEWWGAFLYDFGVALYTAADIFTYISVCPDTQLSHNLYTICIDYFYLVAGIFFLIAGVLYIVVLGSPWIFPNIFFPFNRTNATSMMWWSLHTYFWGGVGFCLSGIFLYWYSPNNTVISLRTYQIENSIGFGGGSFLFFIGAGLLLARQSRGRCRPSYAAINTNSDLTVHAGGAYRAMNNKPDIV